MPVPDGAISFVYLSNEVAYPNRLVRVSDVCRAASCYGQLVARMY